MDNNLPGRIDDYLDQVFGPYEDSPAVAELRIEVRHDLLERLTDLTEHGVGDEVAYAQIISSLGDIESTIRELAGQERAFEGTTDKEATAQPEGPADELPEGETPGETWEDRPPHWSRAVFGGGFKDDLSAEVADAVTTGLSTAWTQLGQAFETLRQGWQPGQGRDWGKRRRVYAMHDLPNRDLHGQDLSNSSFAASNLRGSNFAGATLTHSSFTASDLRNANFDQADLTSSNLSACSLRGAHFERATLTDASLSYSDMRNVCFTGSSLRGARATYADMRESQFNDCAMDGANFTGSDLRKARFDGLSLADVTFNMANLSEASFRGSTLRRVSFRYVSHKSVMTMDLAETVMDRATYLSLQASGHTPQGVRVED